MPLEVAQLLMTLLLVVTFMMLGSKRLRPCVRLYALQSLLIASIATSVAASTGLAHIYLVALLTSAVKVIAIPYILLYIIREIRVQREVELYVNVPSSLMAGGGLVLLALYIAQPIAGDAVMREGLTISLATFLIGLFMMVSRKTALAQILGLLVAENGLFLAAVVLTSGMPLIVELGIAFDALVGVIIMGVLVFRIKRTFDTIDTGSLRNLIG